MKKWIFLVFFMSSFGVYAEDLVNSVIPIEYANPASVQQALNPMLKPGETISVYNQSLIVHASQATLNQLNRMIYQMDNPPQQLLVSVHQGNEDWLNGPEDTINYSANGAQEQQSNQSIQVQSGSYAYISTSKNYPVISQVDVGWATGVGYQRMQADKGLLIQPELQGAKVKINIERNFAQQSPVNQENQQEQKTATTTMVPLDKWVKISQSQGSAEPSDDNTVTYHAGNSFDNQGALYIKITLVKD